MESLRGIIPPLVTPLQDCDSLDVGGLERLVEHLLTGGVHGLFVLGTTGEAPSLGYRCRRELVERVCRLVDHRVPVLVGITDTAFIESVNMAGVAADAGATALVLTTPYYFPVGQTELKEYIRHLIPRLPLPTLLYNMPAMTKISFAIESLQELVDLEGIVGMKDSSGDLDYFSRLLTLRRVRPDWVFFMGPERHLVEALARGAHGGVSGGANIFPRLFVGLYQAVIDGDRERVDELKPRLEELRQIYTIGKYDSRVIKAIKCALSLRGICDDFMGEPFHRFRQRERLRVAEIVEKIPDDL
jgi:4-hydroxy-tetrahydrodipicolinate synthase